MVAARDEEDGARLPEAEGDGTDGGEDEDTEEDGEGEEAAAPSPFRRLTRGDAFTVGDFRWSPDGFDEDTGLGEWLSDGIHFLALDRTRRHLYRLDRRTRRRVRAAEARPLDVLAGAAPRGMYRLSIYPTPGS